MLKSIIVLILVSIVALFFQAELGHALRYLVMVHDKIADGLGIVFSKAPAGRLIQETITLIIIPVVIATVIAMVWLMIRRRKMPHLTMTVWIIWIVLFVAISAQPRIHHEIGYLLHVHQNIY